MNRVSSAALVAAMVFSGGAWAAPPKGDAEKGKQLAGQVCIACHGLDGNGTEPTNPEFPRLAAVQGEYLLKQLKEFKNGKRKSDIMSGIVAGLSDADMTNLAVHYSAQKRKPNAAKNPELVEAGKKFYADGSPDNGVPACYGCHLQDGTGTDKYPHLAGQHAAYTYQQLKRFATSERENDRGLVMQSLASRMSEAEMKAVAEYIMSMK